LLFAFQIVVCQDPENYDVSYGVLIFMWGFVAVPIWLAWLGWLFGKYTDYGEDKTSFATQLTEQEMQERIEPEN